MHGSGIASPLDARKAAVADRSVYSCSGRYTAHACIRTRAPSRARVYMAPRRTLMFFSRREDVVHASVRPGAKTCCRALRQSMHALAALSRHEESGHHHPSPAQVHPQAVQLRHWSWMPPAWNCMDEDTLRCTVKKGSCPCSRAVG